MGIDRGLLELIKTVKFEQMHALRREELLRFGIDKRELVETSWRFVDRGERTSHIDKLVQQRDVDQPQGFRTMRWRLGCSSASNMRVDYRNNGRESLASAVIRFGADQKIVLAATTDAQVRGARVDAPVVEQLKSASQLSLMEVLKESERTAARNDHVHRGPCARRRPVGQDVSHVMTVRDFSASR